MEILKKIAELKAELDGLRPFDKDREAAIMQKLRLDWNYHSNHLEGNSLTFGETKALILFGITAAGKPLRDHFEMTGHDEAVKWVEAIVKEGRPLTETFIRELHLLILKEPSEKPTITPEGLPGKRVIHVGVYKTAPNHVLTPTGEIFRFATPEETPAMMTDLIDWYRQKETDPETHPLLLAAEFHYKFIRIHPFDDGNGRTARILMNFILMKHGYPPVVVKTEDKANYIAALQQSDAGIITPFIEYIGENLAHSLEIMLRGARGENIDEADDVDKEIALIEQKIMGIGRGIEKLKSLEVIIERYNDSFQTLFNIFLQECQKYSKFYNETKVSYSISGNGNWANLTPTFFDDFLAKIIESENSLQSIGLTFIYNMFNGKGIDYFHYKSSITVAFEKNQYKVDKTDKEQSLIKFYHERLTAEEIQMIVRSKTKAHADFINQQIEIAQKKSES